MLELQNLSFSYFEKPVIHDLSFTLPSQNILAILGESGCGKSTLIKLIYGLYDLNQGQILWNQTPVLGPKHHLVPGMPYMKYLAQDFDLMPYTTVWENIGKYLSNFYPQQKQERIQELLEIVEMTPYANTHVRYLSGGQQQRVAIAQVLALEPEVLLLDEPFSHIDNFKKNALRRNLFSYLKSKKITCIIATHDSVDALSYSDKTLILQDGKVIESGNSSQIYHNPKNQYVASLYAEVNLLNQSQLTPDTNLETSPDSPILLYAHQLKISPEGLLKANVRQSYFRGSHYLIKAVSNKKVIFFEHHTSLTFNQEVQLSRVIDNL